MNLALGDVVTMKKKHPCGSAQFTVTRVGMDIKLRCEKCGREVMLPRKKAERAIRAVNRPQEGKSDV